MYKQFVVVFAIALFALTGCKPPTPPEDKGTISVSPSWPASIGNASRITVTVQPGGVSQNSTALSAPVKFSDLAPGTYSVSVVATDANSNTTHRGSSNSISVEAGKEASAPVAMVPVIVIPQPPTPVSASKNSETDITVSWYESSGATGYKVYRSTSASGTFSYVGSTGSTSFSDSNPTQAQWLYYTVTANNSAGESGQSSAASGYRKGWRFENVSVYNPSDGIGLYFDMYAYGFRGVARTVGIYAVYYRDGGYYYVPGSGSFGVAGFKFNVTPAYDETKWTQAYAYIYDNTWDGGWRNNTYPQYIQMRIYKSSSISSFNDPYYDQTAYFSIRWGGSTDNPQPIIIGRLSVEESAAIDRQLQQNTSTTSVVPFDNVGKTGRNSAGNGMPVPAGR